ncbi:Cutinase transcription factor 1 alpha [Venturia inaequalis]|nr:Cutinase transcription factor 1 alpha [Venturia inaequalis]
MQFTTYFTAIFLALATSAAADMGCDDHYCDCLSYKGADGVKCFKGHCANSFPKGTVMPTCY